MRPHITFDSIDCEHLQYIKPAESWVCLQCFLDLKHVDSCMHCRFSRLIDKEKRERRTRLNGGLL